MSEGRPVYTVRARRTERWWGIDAPEIAGLHSQVRRLEQVEAMARDAIAFMFEIDEDSFDLEVDVQLDDELSALRDALDRSREQAELWAARLTGDRNTFVRCAREELPTRDVAYLTHVSHQRVSQIEAKLADEPATIVTTPTL